MDLATVLAAHLQTFDARPEHVRGQPEAAHDMTDFAAGLSSLLGALRIGVPSCLAVSILDSRPAGNLTITAPAAGSSSTVEPAVRASLAVRLAVPARPGMLLLLQAAAPGAFVGLAGELAGQLDNGRAALLMDRHLVLRPDPEGQRLAVDLADLRAVEQAVGALIGQGRLPVVARQELLDRAVEAELTVPALARQFLAALAYRARPD